ncbi:putative O-methyltransferase YrrM [Caulobacter ginsengisoli]|uniref:O-methyltransferase YrrM n=1 Tax=Caulobacter ginsengisoli TaxID=400775 RepID=A0ABU0IXG5_9CAUL|nr:O-methyltransferase [Caulobacter ginsengisoli]MDQ0466065.1 putative O-methyltransferase YrrM [Caulobacter ginsengisoli]
MPQTQWTAVDDYLCEALVPQDEALTAALAASDAAGLPRIAVAPNQGRLLYLLALSVGARRILEVGTLGGYSTIWLARALPADGRLVSLEIDARHAEVARANLAHAGLAERAEVRVGPALDLLDAVEGPLDFSFIDADKQNNAGYFDHALRLTRPGGLIVVDNVVRHGAVIDPDGDSAVQGVRRLMERLAAEPRVEATAIQTVGSKGWDGLMLARVK